MGDPRRFRNKSERPKRLWDKDRITQDKELKTQYGLKNSGEIWKSAAELKKYRREARRLLSLSAEERERDVGKILTKLARLGIMKKGSIVDDILSLGVRDVLERRLQTVVVRKGLAKTMRQSRQLITHGFIGVNSKKITIPSYLVEASEENGLSYIKPFDINAGLEEEPKDAEKESKKSEAPPPAEKAEPAPEGSK
ncbi:30S ribosomal protein S4 [Candidatus Micrarchaeota archaeon]|nr:30S ribosomal protein S4 [Candidatus Micrarchaeota archaeon]